MKTIKIATLLAATALTLTACSGDVEDSNGTTGGNIVFGQEQNGHSVTYERFSVTNSMDMETETGRLCMDGKAFAFIYIDGGSEGGPTQTRVPEWDQDCAK